MIFWCCDQDLFCATWYEIHEVKTKIIPRCEKIQTFEEIFNGICFVLHGMTLMMRKPGLRKHQLYELVKNQGNSISFITISKSQLFCLCLCLSMYINKEFSLYL